MIEKILVVEDESEIRELIALQLRRQGYQVTEAESAEQALEVWRGGGVALIVLDWMLPGMSGRDFTKTLRSMERQTRTSILFVTAKSAPEDIVEGLDVGADDYLPKPFDNAVLLARVRSLLRRTAVAAGATPAQTLSAPTAPTPGPRSAGESVVQFGPLQLDIAGFRAHLDGAELELTRSEFRLLRTLMENQGKVLTRNQLIDHIQGEGVAVVGRTVDTHVFGLRKKLGRHADVIETVRGVGYRIGYLES
ncbi:MAG: response regulator transcription factor [Bdellovibrionales bacterium]|nr:response regulator transcription factor [Bdellovibrionales bacterium]